MAKAPTVRKISRRDVVTLLGAGAVIGTARPETAFARQGPGHKYNCATAVPVERQGQPPSRRLFVGTCCEETRHAILTAVAEPGYAPTNRGKMHLKQLQQALLEETLAEYCVMMWGLSEQEVDGLKARFKSLGSPEKK